MIVSSFAMLADTGLGYAVGGRRSQQEEAGRGAKTASLAISSRSLLILLVACAGLTGAAAAAAEARDAGAGCPVGWGGGVGKAGKMEAPTCQSVRRSFPSIQTGEVIVAVNCGNGLALCLILGHVRENLHRRG